MSSIVKQRRMNLINNPKEVDVKFLFAARLAAGTLKHLYLAVVYGAGLYLAVRGGLRAVKSAKSRPALKAK